MILVLQTDGAVVLEQPTNFRQFHCEIAARFAGPDEARPAFAAVGELESVETAWVDEESLYALGEATHGAGWREQAQAMVVGATRYGWTREHAPRIKSHVVWRR